MITKQQRIQLRSMASTIKPTVWVGKDGFDLQVYEQIKQELFNHELIKISVLKNCSLNIKEVAYDIANRTNSELIQVIGRNIVFYRKSKKQLIEL